MNTNNKNHFDAIIIGSGMGGLTCASLMSQWYHKKVLILERHGTFGGFTHSFSRKGKFTFDVGLHYVGGLQEGASLKNCFDQISAGQLKWQKMPDPFQNFIYPGMKIAVTSNPREFAQDLIRLFPQQEKDIQQYFNDVRKVSKLAGLALLLGSKPKWIQTLFRLAAKPWGSRLLALTTEQYLQQLTTNQELRAVLDSQWGDYGLPSSQSSFTIHALVAKHYWRGAYYPAGGAQKIAETALEQVTKHGGLALKKHEVTEILVQDSKAIGVRAIERRGNRDLQTHEFFAPLIISNAGAKITYGQFLKNHLPAHFKKEVEKMPLGCSAIVLFLGLKEDPRKLGMDAPINWVYEHFDHQKNWEQRQDLIEGKPRSCFVSFGANEGLLEAQNLTKAKTAPKEGYTAQIIGFGDYADFAHWQNTSWSKRGEEYKALKEKISAGLLNLVESKWPGFKSLVEYQELATPLSVEHFAHHPAGQIYGYPALVGREQNTFLRAKTPLKNLLMTGTDVGSVGIAGALMGGLITLSEIYGPGVFKKAFTK